jgi:osmotically-inducible protein OsmY
MVAGLGMFLVLNGCTKPAEDSGATTSGGKGPDSSAGLRPATGDDKIKSAVLAKLASDPKTKNEKVDVEVKDGRVTLKGTVSSDAAKIALEDAVRDAPDVFGVSAEGLTVK